MKTLYLVLLMCGTPMALWAQAPATPANPEPAKQQEHVEVVTTIQPEATHAATTHPAPGAYLSQPDALRVLVPEPQRQGMPRANLPALAPSVGAVAPLRAQRLQPSNKPKQQ